MMKRFGWSLLVLIALFSFVSCASAPKKREVPNRKITLNELKTHDGTAWVAIDGIVYDVTHNKSWCCGAHHGIRAGQDLTERIKKSPHGHKTLANLPIIGTLDDGTSPTPQAAPAPVAAPVAASAPVVEAKPEPQPEPKEEVKQEEPKKEEPKKEEPKKEEPKKEEPKKEEPKKEEPKKK